MKITKIYVLAISAIMALAPIARGQTFQYLDPVAAKYDLFITAGPNASNENDRNYMDFKKSKGSVGGFDGLMGLGQHSWNYVESGVNFSGELNRHSQLYDLQFNPTLQPGAVINPPSSAIDADLNAADAFIKSYVTYLSGLTTTQSFSQRNSAWTVNTTQDVTVLDVAGFNMSGSGDAITLNGRVGGDDIIVIRSNADSLWAGGAPVILNNIDRRNVIWLTTGNKNFDLHKNGGANFEGVIINSATTPQSDYTTIIGDVDFKGQIYASHIKLGTDVFITGSSTFGPPIPEPSSVLLVLTACAGLMFRRSR